MSSEDVTALTAAIDPTTLLTTFIALGGFILAVAALVAGVSLVKWGVKRVRRSISGGAA